MAKTISKYCKQKMEDGTYKDIYYATNGDLVFIDVTNEDGSTSTVPLTLELGALKYELKFINNQLNNLSSSGLTLTDENQNAAALISYDATLDAIKFSFPTE